MTTLHRRPVLAALMLAVIAGCSDAPASAGRAQATDIEGEFSVTVTRNGEQIAQFSSNSDRAKVQYATPEIISLKARKHVIRVMANRLAESGPATTEDINLNNALLQFVATVDGKEVRVSCDPADPPVGQFDRQVLTDTQTAGTARLEFPVCHEYNTEKEISALSGVVAEVSWSELSRTDQD